MSPRALLILVVVAVAAVAGGWYFGTATQPPQQATMDAGKLMFPDLAPKLQKATKIEVVFQGKPMTVALKDGRWGLVDRGGYPVQDTKLHAMLTALTELRLVEARTNDPAQLSRLGVEDPAKPDANSNLLRVLGADDKPIVELVVGHRRVRTQGNVPEQVYVRRPNETQAWLAEGALQVDHDPSLWLDRDIANIDHGRIASVAVTRGDTKLAFARQGDKLALTEPAEHPKLEDYKVEDVARAFELLTFQEVRPSSQPIGEKVGSSVFTTTDGLAITSTVYHADKDIWVSFAISGTDKATAEADALSKKLSGWLYQLGSWKEKALVPTLDDLKAAEATPPAAPTPPGAAAPVPPPSPAVETPSAGNPPVAPTSSPAKDVPPGDTTGPAERAAGEKPAEEAPAAAPAK